jgi:hypothetical protein
MIKNVFRSAVLVVFKMFFVLKYIKKIFFLKKLFSRLAH